MAQPSRFDINMGSFLLGMGEGARVRLSELCAHCTEQSEPKERRGRGFVVRSECRLCVCISVWRSDRVRDSVVRKKE